MTSQANFRIFGAFVSRFGRIVAKLSPKVGNI